MEVFSSCNFLESVTVTVRKLDEDTQILVKERIPPSGFLEHAFGNCATFNIRKVMRNNQSKSKFLSCSAYSDNMRFFQIQSPFKVSVFIHDKNQNKIHIELAKVIRFEGEEEKCRPLVRVLRYHQTFLNSTRSH